MHKPISKLFVILGNEAVAMLESIFGKQIQFLIEAFGSGDLLW